MTALHITVLAVCIVAPLVLWGKQIADELAIDAREWRRGWLDLTSGGPK